MSNALKQRFLSSVIMSMLLSGLMTAWVTWLNLGFVGDFLSRWLHAYLLSWPAAFTIVVLLAPAVQRLSWRMVGGSPVSPSPARASVAAASAQASSPQ
ncbi:MULTISPECIES: DUF2798 domain-containing protein [unclassified Comamonas]|uniref:DUF2798 domain-containing protein n=1 Tax=Comamonas squillarum TaxID=2977320 RepID=A0ABY6A360_9BURK|nr:MULTISPECIES: DUF2798 domain-containing protein [unclassified Comamonas]PWB16095.1 DUF2798 domain-containing protein [Comamonas sp. JNW]UXC20404.1 DUF2798 domain-containing protein [Comamonas sp. PR12]